MPVLIRVLYEGKRSELTKCIDEKLQRAASEVKMVSEEAVLREGKTHEDLLRERKSGGQ